MTPTGVARMAAYNRWMNERLFEAAGRLPPQELTADRGAFFGSILGTLNHLAVADTLWLHRFAQQRPPFVTLAALSAFPRPGTLRDTLAEDLPTLGALRKQLDSLILRWADELSAERLASNLSYANMAGAPMVKNLGALVQHFFNHQTHHRGQASTLLFQAGVDIGVTDLLTLIPNAPSR